MPDNDFIELGESNRVPVNGGWTLNKQTGEMTDPDGRIHPKDKKFVFEPVEDEEEEAINLFEDMEKEPFNDDD